MKNFNKKIVLSGGGTGGSVTPLLQIYKELNKEFNFLFIGTYNGLEKEMSLSNGIDYKPILSGKWRRYFSILNFVDIFKIFFAFWQSLIILIKEKPSVVISAGGFVAVPLSFAAWVLRIPIIIHQQDVIPGLANKLMANIARVITTTFSGALNYYGHKAIWIGNLGPDIKNIVFDKNNLFNKYNLNQEQDLPLILVLGGGTGSLFINKLIINSIKELALIGQVVHVVGREGRDVSLGSDINNYKKIDFINHSDFLALLSCSDLVISRCGLATLTELVFLKKPAILIPMPGSHQEFNALEFEKNFSAIILREEDLSPIKLINEVKNILNDYEYREKLSQKISTVIKNGNKDMISIIKDIVNK